MARAADSLGQSGCVTGIEVTVELEGLNGERLGSCSAKQLRHVRHYRAGMYVTFGSWVGRVEEARISVCRMWLLRPSHRPQLGSTRLTRAATANAKKSR